VAVTDVEPVVPRPLGLPSAELTDTLEGCTEMVGAPAVLKFCTLHPTAALCTVCTPSLTVQYIVPEFVACWLTVDVTAVVAAVEAVRVPVPTLLLIVQE
jgi:hypothetical protein